MLRMVNRLMALSLGVHREQLEQRMGLTWPRPCLLRPLLSRQHAGPGNEWQKVWDRAIAYLFFLFLTILAVF